MIGYACLEHWEERYKKDPEPFDWFNNYAAFKPFLLSAGLDESHDILMLGCGTSTMSEGLWEDGYRSIVNIDFSPYCINLMQQRYADKPGMTYKQAFDFVIDKGTLDCILCGEKSFENAHKALTHISQVLKPGGVYMMISYGLPVFRLNHLQKKELGWTVDVQTLEKPSLNPPAAEVEGKPELHYIYICKKEPAPAEEAAPAEEKKQPES
ncbi:hypothetical protein, conserved [Eimeria maxima]|uniref:Methyltransferase domain-containing protein n=1 Tax=Eimeria maxima TaxID=5804 RepID=U6M314_EIMMA|nr:hypothetical protein, conserved [Eimeria maxima]CDJ56055.1 hypothetical protein, conserved [Eimeria maxima]